MSSELFHTIEQIGREKGLETETVILALEEAYAAATRKYYSTRKDYGARFDPDSGAFRIFVRQTVVEDDDLADPMTEITLEDALKLRGDAELGMVIETAEEKVEAPLTRIAAQAAKQVIYQKVKEAEREIIYGEYVDRVGELLTGQVKRFDRGDMIVDLGRTEGVITRREQSRAEHYNPGDRIRAVLINVERLGKGPQLMLSRASEYLVRKLFEMEVPEIYDATVSIVAISRDAGERSKVAVASRDRDVDPVGACVGMKGSRVQAVIRELRGEKIDIVQWDDDPSNYVRNALNPASINRVGIRDYEDRDMEVIVAEDQLSLAIGKRGQNVRLAAKLVGWNLDIKSEAEKKAEVEAEIQRMQEASVELASLPGIEQETASLLLDAGFRTAEEVSQASMDDLTAIGIPEELALDLHDAAEEWLEKHRAELAEEAARAAEAAEAEEEADGEDADAVDESGDETGTSPDEAPLEAASAEHDEKPVGETVAAAASETVTTSEDVDAAGDTATDDETPKS